MAISALKVIITFACCDQPRASDQGAILANANVRATIDDMMVRNDGVFANALDR